MHARDQQQLELFGEPVKIIPSKPSIPRDIRQPAIVEWLPENPKVETPSRTEGAAEGVNRIGGGRVAPGTAGTAPAFPADHIAGPAGAHERIRQ
jgi:hypothetical protein